MYKKLISRNNKLNSSIAWTTILCLVIVLIYILIFWNFILNTNNIENNKYKLDPQVFKYYSINNSELDGFYGDMRMSIQDFYFVVKDELSHSKIEFYIVKNDQRIVDRIEFFQNKSKRLGFKRYPSEESTNSIVFRKDNSFLKIELFQKEGEEYYTLKTSEIYEDRGNKFYNKIIKWPKERFDKIIKKHQYKIMPN